VTSREVNDLALSKREGEVLILAMHALDLLLKAEVIAVLARDKNGIFIAPKPGLGRSVMHFLQDVDWDTEVLIAEEHFE